MNRLKLYSLQSVWTSRRLPEGDANKPGDPLFTFFPISYSQDPHLNAQLTHLHSLARQGVAESIQQHIDAYLPAVVYLEQNPSHAAFARQMVLSIPDAPQLGKLPDLGPVIRSMLLFQGEPWGFILTPLYAALPGITRRPVKAEAKAEVNQLEDTYQLAICILLALFLGIYPTSVKFPPFHVRAALYRRTHCLLTHGTGTTFCQKHPALLTLALMEYCAYILPTYLPVEHSLLAGEGMDGLFTSCPLLCDAFRQEVLITGEEDWQSMEAYCAPIVERHTRACKSKLLLSTNPNATQAPTRRQQEQFQAVKLGETSLKHLPDLPIIVPYAIHLDDSTHKIMASEMRFLGLREPPLDLKFEQAVALQRAIHVKPLPPNLTQIQIRALSSRVRVCERSALSGCILYTCIQCIMGGQQAINRKGKTFPTRGQCKLDLDSDDLICSICHHHSVLSVNALGRIISMKNHQFYLAPCCCTVQPYTGRGDEFQGQACHHKPTRPASKNTKRRCELCTNIALIEPHEAVDHLTGEPHTTYLCQRHTPHADALRHVVNWRQLQEEIRKRDKPLFFHKRNHGLSGRGKRGGINE